MKLVSTALALTLLAGPALAAGPDAAANELSTKIMSPFCPGVTLHECPSAEALRLRDRIESWFRAGSTEDEILARLETEYGSGIRATPEPEGMGLVAWLVAGAALVGAAATGFALMRKWSRADDGRDDEQPLDATDRMRLDEELARLRTQS